jgi:hypothetical protein
MINAAELRLGNYVLYKSSGRISMVAMSYSHFEALSKGDVANFFPVVLKPELFLKAGFIENMDYPLLPQAREFKLTLPIQGDNKNEIVAYSKSNGECFARAIVNGMAASNNLHHLHQLQNLYFALVGGELEIKK